ncbi:hypothetical protein DYB32_008277 [Aphanomyces invadans]|uniref:Ig-like domain-containing protein n=1 Tax=Aphanomyces invadans TaxID=157072 RepID=A0A418ALK6_9STRA|nr:hypothetical protein DYB32_008277 [Aphanomyces invadans]
MKRFVRVGALAASLVTGESTGVAPCLDAPEGWSAVLGSLTQVAADKAIVCGLNALDDYKVFCSLKKQPASWWQLEHVAFKDVAVRDGVVFGIQTDGKLVTGPSGPTATFVQVPTPFCEAVAITFNGSTLCVVTSRSQIFCASTTRTGFPATVNWQRLDGDMTQLALAGTTVYGVNGQNQLWTGTITDATLAAGVAKWVEVPNYRFQQVAFDGERVCGVTPSLQVVCAPIHVGDSNSAPMSWTALEGELTYVSNYDTSLYGVDAAGHVYVQYLAPPPAVPTANEPPPSPVKPKRAPWTVVPTPQMALVTVSSFGSNVCGTDSAGSIYCTAFNADTPTVVSWVQLQGRAMQEVVVADKGALYGVSMTGGTFYAPTCKATARWVQQSDDLMNLAVDGSVVCGVSRGSLVYCANRNTQTSTPNWTLLDGILTQIVVANGVLFGLDTRNKLWTGSSKTIESGSGSWAPIANSAKYSRISYDGIRLCGVLTPGNKIRCADAGLATLPNWYNVPGAGANMAYVSVQRENLFALMANSTLLYRALDAGDEKN